MTLPARALLILALALPGGTPLLGQQSAGPIEIRALFGTALAVGPEEFSGYWRERFGGALSAVYTVAGHTAIAATIEYQPFAYSDNSVFTPPPGQFRTTGVTAAVWAGWLEVTRLFALNHRLNARVYAGPGVVAFGAARTGLGLRVGAGLDVPVSGHFSLIFDASFAHAFTQANSGTYSLSSPFSYAPLRAGVGWR